VTTREGPSRKAQRGDEKKSEPDDDSRNAICSASSIIMLSTDKTEALCQLPMVTRLS